MSHTHLSTEDRVCIALMLEKGESQANIARHLDVHRSTISREIKRNSNKSGKYNPSMAQKRYKARRKLCKITPKLVASEEQRNEVITHIRQYWSPEQITNAVEDVQVSVSTIYRAIHNRIIPRAVCKDRMRRLTFKRGWKKGKKRNTGENLPPIRNRPRAVTYRSEPGHWELDTVVMKRSCRWGLLTLVERVSRFPIAVRISNKVPEEVTAAIIKALSVYPPEMRKTLTTDRGAEFFGWADVEAGLPGTKVYFADPHAPYQRGTNENTNGLYRQFFPKKTHMEPPSDEHLAKVNELLANRPRKCLDWASPYQVFSKILLHLA